VTKPEQLKALAKKMKPNHLKMAKALAQDKSQAKAYLAGGGTGKDHSRLGNQLIINNPCISEYASLAKEMAAESAQEDGVATFAEKAKLLMLIATKGTQAAFDKDGNEGLTDARAATGAIAELNKMSGDLASIKTESKHTFDDADKDELERQLAELKSLL
jgi:hypothetical protein